MEKEFFSVTEVAELLGISRVAVFKKIKAGQIAAKKIGRQYAISSQELAEILGSALSEKRKREIEGAVAKVVRDYSKTLRLLGKD